MLHITAVHTVFHKDELFDAAALLYDLGTPIKSRFVSNGLNDTYAVETDTGKFILRIYKHQWRTEYDIQYELDLLTYLKGCGLPVSYPIPRRDGSCASTRAAGGCARASPPLPRRNAAGSLARSRRSATSRSAR